MGGQEAPSTEHAYMSPQLRSMLLMVVCVRARALLLDFVMLLVKVLMLVVSGFQAPPSSGAPPPLGELVG